MKSDLVEFLGQSLPLVHNVSKAKGNVKATIQAINHMQADEVIGKYAIGGAVGATFYLAPAATVDLDLFVILPKGSGLLVSLSPIYEYLKARGGTVEDEYIVVEGWPLQFILPGNALEHEAIDRAVATNVEGVPTRVMSAEHLVAIALNTGRAKDFTRILQFVEQEAVDLEKLNDIVERHHLSAKWDTFEQRFLRGSR